MAEYDYEEAEGEEAPRPTGAPSPFLQQFEEQVGPAAPEQVSEVTTRLNDYFQRRSIADANEQAGQQFVADIDGFKSGLVSMVKADPHAVNVAMDIAPVMLDAIGSTMPGDNADHFATVAQHIQREIATSAVTSMAEQQADAARAMLGQPHIAELLGDAKEPLHAYIDAQETARAIDHEADLARMAKEQTAANDRSAFNYVSALHDIKTDTASSPPGWHQQVMSDNALSPDAKVRVMAINERLTTQGDAPMSDPQIAAKLIREIVSGVVRPSEILDHAGAGLRLQDALMLSTMAQGDVKSRREMGQMQQTIEAAQRYMLAPDNGPGGQLAYERFVNWLLPRYHAAGPGSLHPLSESYILPSGDGTSPRLFWDSFKPSLEDYVTNAKPPGPLPNPIYNGPRGMVDDPSMETLPRGQPPAGDEVIGKPRIFKPVPTYEMDENAIQNPVKRISDAGYERPSLNAIFSGGADALARGLGAVDRGLKSLADQLSPAAAAIGRAAGSIGSARTKR